VEGGKIKAASSAVEKAKAVRRKSLKVLRGEYQKIKYFELPNPKSFGGEVREKAS